MIGPYAIQDDHFTEREEYFLRIAKAMNFASENIAQAKKDKKPKDAKFWVDMHRPMAHACATIQDQLRAVNKDFYRYEHHLRKMKNEFYATVR